jgi:class 3 adenylate cyclase
VVNTARRMLDVAITGPGGIVASGAIVAHMSGNASDVSLGVDLGEVKLRGRGAPVHLWRILL